MIYYDSTSKVNDLYVRNAIKNLYRLSKVFPNQKIDIYERISNLARVLPQSYNDELCSEIVIHVNDVIDRREKEKKKHQHEFKITNLSEEQKKEAHNKRVQEEREKVELDKLYYAKVASIVSIMYRDLSRKYGSPDKIPDDIKLRWIYEFVIAIDYPSYSQYRTDMGNLDPLRAQVNTYQGLPNVPFGIFDKYNIFFSNEKSGLCGAKAELFTDLMDFACFSNTLSGPISGLHMSERHGWNIVLTPNGVWFLDASTDWHHKRNTITLESKKPVKGSNPIRHNDGQGNPQYLGTISEFQSMSYRIEKGLFDNPEYDEISDARYVKFPFQNPRHEIRFVTINGKKVDNDNSTKRK